MNVRITFRKELQVTPKPYDCIFRRCIASLLINSYQTLFSFEAVIAPHILNHLKILKVKCCYV